MQTLGAASVGGKLIVMQRYAHHHTLREGTDRWHENWFTTDHAPFRHLWQVLVFEIKSVSAPRLVFFLLVHLDERLTAARVPAHRVHRQRRAWRQDARVNQWSSECDEPGGIAPRI